MIHFIQPLKRLVRNPDRWRLVLFSGLGLAVAAVCVYFFAISVGHPYMGLDLVYQNQAWEVSAVDINGLASRSGVKMGDRPIEVNGQPAPTFLQQYEKTGTVYGILIKDLTVMDEQQNIVSVSLEDVFPFSPTLIVQISTFIVCLAFWITGFYVYIKRPKNKAARLLCIIGLTTGTLLCGNIAGDISIRAGVILSVISSVLGPWLLLHFFLVLPEERTWAQKNPLVYLIYLPPLITLILFPFFGYADDQPLPGFRIARFFEMGAGLLAVGAVLVYNYVRAGSTRTRQQMKIVLVACLAAFVPFFVLYLLPQMTVKQNLIPPGYSSLFLVFIPIGMGIAVVTHRLMDIDFVMRRGAVYTLISVVMAGILSVALFTVIAFQQSLGVFQRIIIALLLGGAATALFGPTKKYIELLIDKLFYKDRYDYRQTIHSFSTSLNTMQEITDVSRLLVGTATHTLNLAGGCLFIKTQSGFYEVSTAQGIFTDPDKQQELYFLVSQHNKETEFPNSAKSINPEVAFLLPLIVGGKELGILCLSEKVSRQNFSLDDTYLLQGLVSVASTAVESALLIRDVSLRNTFVSIASHELRIPLTAIMGYAELMLLRETPEESRKKWVTKIIAQGQKINSMVDDLLNVSRIQSGKVIMKTEIVKMDDFLAERLSGVQESNTKHSFELRVEPGLPPAFVDRDKFGQVISNLLSNAVKFSPKGGRIILAARKDTRQDPANRRIVVSVADEGIGIGPDDKASLFTTFHRIQRPETQGIRGSGLGLYIVKEWAQAMGGEVWLESELNKGSTFFVAVPAVNSHQPE